jgi:hypothetical protein
MGTTAGFTKDELYHSFYGFFTVAEAISHLGGQHVAWLANLPHEQYVVEIRRGVTGSWSANNGASHKAYCALMQAGQGIIAEYLGR